MIEVVICVGTECSYKGGLQIHDFLERDATLVGKILVTTARCLNKACKPDQAPVVSIGGQILKKATLDQVLALIREKLP
jgi:NADH:ubiquinone oxidoreductase subunit E